jgi:hypothetical protein
MVEHVMRREGTKAISVVMKINVEGKKRRDYITYFIIYIDLKSDLQLMESITSNWMDQ